MPTAACLLEHVISHPPVFVSYRVIALEISTCELRHMLCNRTDLESATGTHDDTTQTKVAIRRFVVVPDC